MHQNSAVQKAMLQFSSQELNHQKPEEEKTHFLFFVAMWDEEEKKDRETDHRPCQRSRGVDPAASGKITFGTAPSVGGAVSATIGSKMPTAEIKTHRFADLAFAPANPNGWRNKTGGGGGGGVNDWMGNVDNDNSKE